MYPILFENSYLVIPAWHFFLVIAAVVTYYSMQWLNSRFRLIEDRVFLLQLFLVVYPAGYLGARLLSIFLVEKERYPSLMEKLSALLVLGPMTLYGSVIAAVAVSLVFVSYKKQSFVSCFDLAGPSWLLGVAIGRIGCFLNGDDFGWALRLKSWDERPWWSVSFPNLDDVENQVARYPVQIYEVLFCCIFAGCLVWFFPKLRKIFGAGSVGILSLVLYGCGRFANEFYRADFRGSLFSSVLSPAQVISVIVVLAGVALLSFRLFDRSSSHSPGSLNP